MFGYNYSTENYLDLAFHPVETAITNRDELVHLLVRLGASVNTVPRNIASSLSHAADRISLKDWIDDEIHIVDTRIKRLILLLEAPSTPITSPPEHSGWRKFCTEYQESLKIPLGEERRQALEKRKEREEKESLEKLEDAKAYFVEVKQLIEDHGAKSMKTSTGETLEAVTSAISLPEVEPRSYVFLSTGYSSRGKVPQHLLSSYDELYEACYIGDHEKIQSLCLPADAKPGSILLNISVKMMDRNDSSVHGK
jgi:hypothetical protein